MLRREFFALASGLLVPWQPERVYSFLPAWRLVPRANVEMLSGKRIKLMGAQEPGKMFVGRAGSELPGPLPGMPGYDFVARHNMVIINPEHRLDLEMSAQAFGVPLVIS